MTEQVKAKVQHTTLRSTLSNNQPKQLAEVLAQMAGDLTAWKVLESTLKDAMKQVPTVLADNAKAIEEKAKNRATSKVALKAEREAEKALKLAALEVEQKAMLDAMTQPVSAGGFGLDADTALQAVQGVIKAKRKAIETASVRPQVQVNVNGNIFTMPEYGNTTQEIKDIIESTGLDRVEFVAKYKVQ